MSSAVLDRELELPFRKNTWQEAILEYVPERLRHGRVYSWVEFTPTLFLLVLSFVLTLRLSNTAFIDQALQKRTHHGEEQLSRESNAASNLYQH